MNIYLKSQNETNTAIINNKFTQDELKRFSMSDYRWSNNRNKPNQSTRRTVKKGEIYQFEFGKNYIPEMSYEHRGLVIGVRKKLLYVLPIFSYNPAKHPDVYHPIDSPTSKSDMFLLKNSDFSFISHDSVLKLNDIRTISVNRILYQQSGVIPISSDTYKKIEELVLQKYFPEFIHEHTQIIQRLNKAESILKEKESDCQILTKENEELKRQIEEFNKRITNTDSQMLAETVIKRTC